MRSTIAVIALVVVALLLVVQARDSPRMRKSPTPDVPLSTPQPSAALAADGPVVRVSGGLIRGSGIDGGVFIFASIPFAAPPVGALRWLPPEPAAPWSDVRDGSATPPMCVQDGPAGLMGTEN